MLKQTINLTELPKSLNSHAVRAGNFMYTTGQIGRNPETGELKSGIEDQTRQVLNNLQTIVKSQGLTLENVVKIKIYVTNLDDVPKLNEVYYSEFFKENRPARTCVEVSKIAIGALLELEAVIVCE